MLVDLSHTIEAGMITYKGLPAPVICDYLSREDSRKYYDNGTEFNISKIEMVANTGTYLDAPFHRYEDGIDLSELPLTSLANLEGVLIKIDSRVKSIDSKFFRGLNLEKKAVLINTGWDKNWRTDSYFESHPFITEDAADYLMKEGVTLVGIDSYNIDDTSGRSRPAHSILLANNIPIVEHMCGMDAITKKDFLFTAVPPKVKNFGTFPVRAFAH